MDVRREVNPKAYNSSQRMEGQVPNLPIGWTIDETMLV